MSTFKKHIVKHPNLYITSLTKSQHLPYILFVHGGPGLNCGVLEYLIEHEGIFDKLNFNLVLYDQRSCGRSQPSQKPVLHADNVEDLDTIYRIITEKKDYNIAAIAGHSYGAKLVADYFQQSRLTIPSILIATAPSILTPRITNLLLDLAYLKILDKSLYQTILQEFDEVNLEKLWQLTEKLEPIFQQNKKPPFFYWANLDWQQKIEAIQNKIRLPINTEVFTSVRRDLYLNPKNHVIDLDTITSAPHLWINGFHDLIMNSALALAENSSKNTLFFKSAHYPHIEEHERFCSVVNQFIKNGLTLSTQEYNV